MATMNVSLPDEMKAWVDEQVASGAYAGASDLVRALVRRERDYRDAVQAFQALIDEAEASGVRTRTKEEIGAEVLARRNDAA